MPQLRNLPDGKTVKSPFIGPTAYLRLHGRNAGAWYAHAPKEQTSIISTHTNGAPASYAHAPKEQTLIISPHANASARYCYDYSDSELESFVPVISKAMSEGKKTQIFFNNHPDGSGAKNARRLKDLLDSSR